MREHVKLGASGKIISSFDVARTLALGADWCNSARGFMFALGCIQAQTCHTGNCPTGVTTQDPQRQMALVVPSKAERVNNFHQNTLESFKELLQAAGLSAPEQLKAHHFSHRISQTETQTLAQMYPALSPGALLKDSVAKLPEPFKTYWGKASAESFHWQ
jgi:glutamate synthase domain-containing protein 2